MRKRPYFKRAAHRFLQGSSFKTPVEAVEAGERTLDDWSRVLLEERELEKVFVESQSPKQLHRRAGFRRVDP